MRTLRPRLSLFAALALATGLGALSVGCRADERTQPGASPVSAPEGSAPARIEFIPAPESEDLPTTVLRELGRARADRRDLLVYVGATWCEPCRHFHEAATRGDLDQVFPGLRLLEFDLDRDRDRLQQAGYGSKMIPLFALPRPDGMGSGEQIEGSIKGPGAAQEIAPRLRALLDRRGGR